MGRGPDETFFQRRHTVGQQVHEKMLDVTSHQGNAMQTHRATSHLLGWLLQQTQKMVSGLATPLCSLQHYSPETRHEKALKKYGVSTQWNVQPLRKFCLWPQGWNLMAK